MIKGIEVTQSKGSVEDLNGMQKRHVTRWIPGEVRALEGLVSDSEPISSCFCTVGHPNGQK